jgi:hypothetical protein
MSPAPEPAVPRALSTALELHKAPEPEWLTIKEAAEQIADGESLKKVERRIRFWAKDTDSVRWKQDGPSNAPLLVAIEDVLEAAAKSPAREREVNILPIPVEVFDDLREMREQLIEAERAQARAEAKAEFKIERARDLQQVVDDLKEQLESEREKVLAAAKRRWFRKS